MVSQVSGRPATPASMCESAGLSRMWSVRGPSTSALPQNAGSDPTLADDSAGLAPPFAGVAASGLPLALAARRVPATAKLDDAGCGAGTDAAGSDSGACLRGEPDTVATSSAARCRTLARAFA